MLRLSVQTCSSWNSSSNFKTLIVGITDVSRTIVSVCPGPRGVAFGEGMPAQACHSGQSSGAMVHQLLQSRGELGGRSLLLDSPRTNHRTGYRSRGARGVP